MSTNKVTLRSILTGMLFAAVFAVLTVFVSNRYGITVTASQIPILPYLLLVAMILLLNPVCRLIRVARKFSAVEIMIVFLMGLVSSSLSTFGLSEHLVPIAGSLFNREWNTPQSEWNRYLAPFINNEYFVSEPGIRAAARQNYDALVKALELKTVYETARRFKDTQVRADAAEAELKKAEADTADSAEKKAVKVGLARIALDNARRVRDEADQEWQTLQRERQLDADAVVNTYPALVEQSQAQQAAAEKLLDELENKAFDKVTLFRRGLPKGQSSYPGIFPVTGDDFGSYFGRVRRLTLGMAALKEIKQALRDITPLAPAQPPDAVAAATLAGALDAAMTRLSPLTETAALDERKDHLRQEEDVLSARRQELDKRLQQLNEEKRNAQRGAALDAANLISDLAADLKNMDQRRKKLALFLERNEWQLTCARNVQALSDRIGTLKTGLPDGKLTAAEIKQEINEIIPAFAAMDISLRRYFLGEIPWSHWLPTLGRWALLVAMSLMVLMALNVLIFRQWAHNEKLTYPLAELPKALIGGIDYDGGIPPVFRNGLFWIGVAVSGITLGWNVLCATQLVPDLTPLNLRNSWYAYMNNTQFNALRGVRSEIFFTMIGLSFLVPKNISFSLWFFHLLFLVQLLLMVWTGQGQDERSFPSDWWYLQNFRVAEGQGALIIFASVVLYKCKKYILCAFMPAMISDLETDEQRELKFASLAFIGGSCGVILMIWLDMGANLWYTLFCYFVFIVIVIGLVRAVTEGGLLSFQCWASPFHFIRTVFGLNHSWTSASLFAPLMIYYAIIMLDIKAFIAPAMANAIKLRDDFRIRRGVFHLAIALAIVVSAVTAIAVTLMMCYDRGADTMGLWFYTSLPRTCTFDIIRTMTKDAPAASPALTGWIGVGAAAMAALLYFRQFVFWLPHPIGLIMLVNPLMVAYWFSILLGWLGNVVVTKYGNKEMYHRASGFFIGLIVGELLIIVVSTIISVTTGMPVAIDLNRN